MMPEVIYPSVLGFQLEIKIIRLSSGFEDGTNLNLIVVNQERNGSLI